MGSVDVSRQARGPERVAVRFRAPIMAAANDEIDRISRLFGLFDSELFCECNDVRCRERRTVSSKELAALRADSRPFLIAEHAPRVQPGSRTTAAPRRQGVV